MNHASFRHSVSLSILAMFAAACGSSSDSSRGPSGEATASASVALTRVPADVRCVEIDVTGDPSVTRRFDVAAGANAVLSLKALPVGSVDFSGSALSRPCSDTTGVQTWTTEIVSTTLVPGAVAEVALTFRRQGQASVDADFEEPENRTVTTFAGALEAPGNADGAGVAARFRNPHFVVLDGGNLYVTDGRNNTIRQVATSSGQVTTLAGTPTATGADLRGVDADGVGPAASFGQPMGIAADGRGNLYVADVFAHTIRKIVIATKAVTTIAGVAGTAGSTDGVGSAALFNQPYGLACDGTHLFVGDAGNDTIRQISLATSAVTTLAGAVGQTGTTDGIGPAARFTEIVGMATDGFAVYVADGTVLREVIIRNGQAITIAGSPTPGAADGLDYGARFRELGGVAYDGSSKLFMTDLSNENIRSYDLFTGQVTTLAGTIQLPDAEDGIGPNARFDFPLGIATDATDTLYVADLANAAIRKL